MSLNIFLLQGREGKMILSKVCTPKLQTFHKPSKSYFGSPVKAEKPSKTREAKSSSKEPMVLEPDTITREDYWSEVRNMCINIAASNKMTMPFLQTIAPAVLWVKLQYRTTHMPQ